MKLSLELDLPDNVSVAAVHQLITWAHELEAGSGDQEQEQTGDTVQPEGGAADTTGRKRVRRTKAQIEADKAKEAAAMAASGPPNPVASPMPAPAAPTAVPPMPAPAAPIATPPAPPMPAPPAAPAPAAAPPAPPPMPAAPVAVPQPPAMPAPPAPAQAAVDANGHMLLDDFRATLAGFNQSKPGVYMNVMTQQNWYKTEDVPAEYRAWVVHEVQKLMAAG